MKNAAEALELTLRSIIEAREARPASTGPFKLTAIKASDSARERIPTRAESAMKRLASAEDHREELAVVALRWIGEQLYRAGGTDLMRSTLEAVADRNVKGGLMLAIADSRWNGIGAAKGNPGWCS